ncbi:MULTISPECIES: hypothetical protein [Geobacillus]|jgi:hypothetical protein|uniref:Uncharacterized protein n=1 Tax=Geobacillus zalihae TaxID=213419 RepID=A0A7H1RUR5_9BACL|nr:hypothetical protein GC56T3_2846 [Geobacillus sp. C56-T3]AMQ19779.1 hypothetical protein A0V43_00945 [Geobacillus sp. JS12]EPR28551.1 hypothetical protein I656_01844 [Geobacillus sp. WSUCF1]KDE50046.1 hypothetical protein DI44_02310 [Geobacillus sp. CAMR5420]KZM54779.1 hypothetical protein A3Q36_07935 [Geobacillus stearothermophilus]ODA17686.1 hypothetical protein A5N86_08320 [Geobacillus thermoleovorans]OQP18156.1 hypothetical protein B1693_00455 [Geobacillus zalihae]PJW16160.1 hypotheti
MHGHFFHGHGHPFEGHPAWKGAHMHKGPHRGAKTFRRGRALEFLARLYVKRETLKQQLQSPELQSIHPVLTGELKAIEMVINEFIQSFDIHDEELSSIWGVQNRDGDAPIDEQRNDEDSSEQ